MWRLPLGRNIWPESLSSDQHAWQSCRGSAMGLWVQTSQQFHFWLLLLDRVSNWTYIYFEQNTIVIKENLKRAHFPRQQVCEQLWRDICVRVHHWSWCYHRCNTQSTIWKESQYWVLIKGNKTNLQAWKVSMTMEQRIEGGATSAAQHRWNQNVTVMAEIYRWKNDFLQL